MMMVIAIPLTWGCNAIFAQTASSANFGKNWILGGAKKFSVEFNGTNASTGGWDTLSVLTEMVQGHSSISDSFGNIVLVTNGGRILNKNKNVIENGDTLLPVYTFSQSGGAQLYQQATIILPMPDSQYYVFATTFSDSQKYNLNYYGYDSLGYPNEEYWPADLLLSNKVDMGSSANNGLGKVVKRMDTLIYDNVLAYCQMTAIRNGNGRDWWLIKQAHDTNVIYSFLVTPDSIYGPVIQGFTEPHFGLTHIRGQSVFNKDGNRYASINIDLNKVFVADFDRCSGLFSNPLVYDIPCVSTFYPYDSSYLECKPYSLAFSPNGQFLYAGRYYSVSQLDLNDPDTSTRWYTAAWPADSTWFAFAGYSSLELGPNNKMYIGNINSTDNNFAVINNPDVKGVGCNFCANCLQFPPQYYLGLPYYNGVTSPPNMPHYELGNYFPCDTLQALTNVPALSASASLSVYPSPTKGPITFSRSSLLGGAERVAVLNLSGQALFSAPFYPGAREAKADLSSLPSGIYLYHYWRGDQLLQSGKITKE